MAVRKNKIMHRDRLFIIVEDNDNQQTEIQDGNGKVLMVVPFGVGYQQGLEAALDKVVDENIT